MPNKTLMLAIPKNGETVAVIYWIEKIVSRYHWDIKRYNPGETTEQYDLGLAYLFPYKIPTVELEKAPWINFHPGPLPEMGGRNLAYHAIMEGRKKFGATIHFMNEGFDTGNIIQCDRFSIKPEYTAEDLVNISHEILESFLRIYLPKFLRGEVVPSYQNNLEHYYHKQVLSDEIDVSDDIKTQIKALYCRPHFPTITVGGIKYYIMKDGTE